MPTMQKIVSLCKRRGFIFPGSDIYGGLANTWDWGPLGVELVRNVKNLWWKKFVNTRSDIVGIQSDILMNPKVWRASGHLKEFSDPLVECKKCHQRFRADQLRGGGSSSLTCPNCDGKLTKPKQFNLLFKTFIGPIEDENEAVYLRPETAQGMFVNYKNIRDTQRLKLPFGIAQIGKAFRNEITPGNFIFRVLEFEQMEIEYFIKPPKTDKDWQKIFKEWEEEMADWLKEIGLNKKNWSIREHDKEELSHYSKKTIDFEFDYPFGTEELYGLAYRTDFDLKAHQKLSGEKLAQGEIPHVIEPTFGLERTILALLCQGYCEEKVKGRKRLVLKLNPNLSPIKVAVLPLVKNKKALTDKARRVFEQIKEKFSAQYDESGSIGKRYRRFDEIGCPLAITVDFDTLEDDSVTIRERDSMEQERMKISQLGKELKKKLEIRN